jgi:hypothetical protein
MNDWRILQESYMHETIQRCHGYPVDLSGGAKNLRHI